MLDLLTCHMTRAMTQVAQKLAWTTLLALKRRVLQVATGTTKKMSISDGKSVGNPSKISLSDGFGREKTPRQKTTFPTDFHFPTDISVGNPSGHFFLFLLSQQF